ncbi:MAG: hypothetical protein V1802_03325 [Candidatus Aenigmatarchaeota archaeon]
MLNYVSNLREYTIDGLREFSKHPKKSIGLGILDFVKDYWDLGAVVLAGFAFNDYESKRFGDYRFYVGTLGGIAGAAGGVFGDLHSGVREYRFSRNMYVGGAALVAGWTNGIDVPERVKTMEKGVATLITAGAIFFEIMRRREKTRKEETIRKRSFSSSYDGF